jgi:phage/plasmid primase-like uncharacterized protein
MGPDFAACPFCGLEPRHGYKGDDDGGYWFIECPQCSGGDGHPFCGVHADSGEQARAIWNRRPPIAVVIR